MQSRMLPRTSLTWIATLVAAASWATSATAQSPGGLDLAQLTSELEVLVDEPSPGEIWALGHSYKTRFDKHATTFFPFQGGESSGYEPVSFSLESVRLGDQSVEFDRAATPTLEEGRRHVSFARESLIERYALERDSIEQLFLFEELPRRGALELRIAASGEHDKLSEDGQLVLAGPESRVRYSSAVAIDASGKRTELATSWENGDIVIRMNATDVALAELPLTIDPIVESYGIQQSSLSDLFPDMALDMNTYLYLVVWQRRINSNDNDVLGMFFNRETGQIIGYVPIDITTEVWNGPRVASSAETGKFVVAASRLLNGTSVITTRDVTPLSLTPGPTRNFGPGINPDIGGDADGTGVINYMRMAFQRDERIRVVVINAEGTTGVGNQLELSAPNCILPTISRSNGSSGSEQRWTIVAHQFTTNQTLAWQVSEFNDLLLDGVSVGTSATPRFNPTVTTVLDGSSEPCYVVAHEFFTDVGSEVELVLMRGAVTLDARPLSALDGSSSALARFNADVASDGKNIVVSYQETGGGDANVYTSSFRVMNDQLQLVEGRVPTGSTMNLEGTPAVLAARDAGGSSGRFQVVYSRFLSGGVGFVYGEEYVVPVANDTCAEAEDVSTGTIHGTLVGATLDVSPGCGFPDVDDSDVWYRFTSPVTGRVTLATCGTYEMFGSVGGATTILSVYDDRSCPVDPASETCSDSSAPTFCGSSGEDAILEFDAVAGSTYLIRVGTRFDDRQEDFQLEITAAADNLGVTFCLCTHDAACGNTSTTAGCTNASGVGAFLEASGSRSIGNADLAITCRDMPANAPGILFAGSGQLSLPFFNGRRCSSGPFFRFPVRVANSSGVASESGSATGGIAGRVQALAGQTTRLQWWYRDGAGPCGTVANYSSGFAVTWLP